MGDEGLMIWEVLSSDIWVYRVCVLTGFFDFKAARAHVGAYSI